MRSTFPGPRPPALVGGFTIHHINRYRQINSRKVERDIFDGGAGLDTFGLWDKVRSKL